MSFTLFCGRFELNLGRPLVMGIVNATPDSFSTAAPHQDEAVDLKQLDPNEVIEHARQLLAQGADILDIGAESTRPGAQPVDAQEEWRRLAPVLEALRDCGVPLSVDTFKPEIMRKALDVGVDMINDVYGFRQPGAIDAVAGSRCGLCVMHMQGEPRTMQQAPSYVDITAEVQRFLRERVLVLSSAGVSKQRIVLDPGFGFGKTVEHNYALLRRLDHVSFDDLPVLLGLSRKSMIGAVTGRPAHERLAGSLAAALAGVERGARILRVHDVAETRDALNVWEAVKNNGVSI